MELSFQLQVVETRCRSAVSEKEQLETKLNHIEKEKRASEKKLAQQQTKLAKLTSELTEEKEVTVHVVPYSMYFSRATYFADFTERAQFANFEISKFNH